MKGCDFVFHTWQEDNCWYPAYITFNTFTESCDAACAERIPGEGGVMPMLSFNFILGLNFLFFCFKIIIIHYHTQKQKIIKFKPRIELNHNTYIY